MGRASLPAQGPWHDRHGTCRRHRQHRRGLACLPIIQPHYPYLRHWQLGQKFLQSQVTEPHLPPGPENSLYAFEPNQCSA